MRQFERFTKDLNLSGPISSYLRAVNTGAKEDFSASFAEADIFGADVHFDVLDVTERQGRTVGGRVSGDQITVTGRVTGDFPGSPVELRYHFSLEGAKIARLEIAP